MPDVAFYEVFAEEKKALKKYLSPSIKARFFDQTVQEFATKKIPARLISVRTQSEIPLAWAKDLQGILTRSTGYDHLSQYRRQIQQKMACGYLPNYCSRAVAEQAVLMTMALLRKLPAQTRQFDRFNRDGITGKESAGRNLLVVGVGRIGREVVDMAKGLRMNVKGVDIVRRLEGLKYVSLKTGLAWAEAVICALPLTDKTKGLLNYALFPKARREMIFVNVGRGEVSPVKELNRLLEEGILVGVGLDVFENETEIAEVLRQGKKTKKGLVKILRELKLKENVLFTPHNAFNTLESVERKAKESALAVQCFLKKKTFPNLIPEK